MTGERQNIMNISFLERYAVILMIVIQWIEWVTKLTMFKKINLATLIIDFIK